MNDVSKFGVWVTRSEFSEKSPDCEVSYDPMLLQKMFSKQIFDSSLDKRSRRKNELKINRIWVAAKKYLTEKQLRIFYLRFGTGLKELEIAEVLSISQPMVSVCIKNSIKKLKKKMRLKK